VGTESIIRRIILKLRITVVYHTTFIISLKYNFEYTFHAEHILHVNILIAYRDCSSEIIKRKDKMQSITNTLRGLRERRQ